MATYCAWCGDYCGQRYYYVANGTKMGWFCSNRCISECPYGCGTPQGADCFITTAVCDILGKADDCDELTTLRDFRDSYMLTNRTRSGLVDLYYETAPSIAQRMLESGTRDEEAARLYNAHIRPAVDAIKAGHNEEGMRIYTEMMASFGVKSRWQCTAVNKDS